MKVKVKVGNRRENKEDKRTCKKVAAQSDFANRVLFLFFFFFFVASASFHSSLFTNNKCLLARALTSFDNYCTTLAQLLLIVPIAADTLRLFLSLIVRGSLAKALP